MNIRFISKLLILQFSILILIGCGTSKNQYKGLSQKMKSRKFDAAVSQIEKAKEEHYDKEDRVLYWLDLGMLYHFKGDYRKSIDMLTKAENAIEDLYTVSISKEVGAAVSNDNTKDYIGEDYEDIYINIFKALSFLSLKEYDSAMVEIRKVHIKINKLSDKYKPQNEKAKEAIITFHSSALAHYLSLLLYRLDNDLDDAAIDKKKIVEAFELQKKLYPFSMPKMPDIENYNDGKGRLNVIAFSGFGPEKVAKAVRVITGSNFINLNFEEGDQRYRRYFGVTRLMVPAMRPGYNFKFEFPAMKKRGSRVNKITIAVNGQEMYELQLLENIQKIATATFQNKLAGTIAKTVTRAAIKYIASIAASEATRQAAGDLAGAVMAFTSSTVASATENADLRLSYFFPAHAHVGEITLDPGNYDIEVRYYNGSSLLWADTKKMDVKPNKFNFIESFYFK